MNVDGSESNLPSSVKADLLGRLLDEHAAALGLYARQWCDSPDDAVQEALIELARQDPLPRDVLAWLYRVVRNKAISASRAARRRQRHESGAAGTRREWFMPGAEESLDGRQAAEALESLPLEQREVVIAHVWGRLTFAQIAGLIGTSDSTAHRRYLAALTALRERLNVPCPSTPNDPKNR